MKTELDSALSAAWGRCRAAAAGVVVPCAAFSSFLSSRRAADVTLAMQLATSCLDDLYLACACIAGDAAAVTRFEREILPCVEPVLARWAPVVADETRQQVRAMILVDHNGRGPLLQSYAGRGPLRGWVAVVAARQASKTWRADHRAIPVDDDALFDALAPASDPTMSLIKAEAAAAFKAAFVLVLGELPRRERTMLRLHFLDALSIDDIAPMYGVHRATVARWLAAARAIVLSRTRDQLRQALGITTYEVDSLIRLVESRIEFDTQLLASRG